MTEDKKNTDTTAPVEEQKDELEERALSVFASERNEDITALVLSLITTFIVLLFTKWM